MTKESNLMTTKKDKHSKLKDGYVYLIKNKATNLIKIGSTENLSHRVKILKSSFVHVGKECDLTVLGYVKCDKHLRLEKYFHKKYHSQRQIGEWFELNDIEIQDIINEMNAMDLKQYMYTEKDYEKHEKSCKAIAKFGRNVLGVGASDMIMIDHMLYVNDFLVNGILFKPMHIKRILEKHPELKTVFPSHFAVIEDETYTEIFMWLSLQIFYYKDILTLEGLEMFFIENIRRNMINLGFKNVFFDSQLDLLLNYTVNIKEFFNENEVETATIEKLSEDCTSDYIMNIRDSFFMFYVGLIDEIISKDMDIPELSL